MAIKTTRLGPLLRVDTGFDTDIYSHLGVKRYTRYYNNIKNQFHGC
jgi:hypothetical protein